MWNANHHPNAVFFEQPMNEHIRMYLRLERLFEDLNESINNPTSSGSQAALSAIVKIGEVVNRPDLKSKLTQTLTQHLTSLSPLRHVPKVDHTRLQQVMTQLQAHLSYLNSGRKIGTKQQQNEFLNYVRVQLSSPGGIAPYKIPAYNLWLQSSSQKRINDLQEWGSEFAELHDMVRLVLGLTRDSALPKMASCSQGFYHQTLDAQQNYELIRVGIPVSANTFPEFSVGKHRLNIRFLTPNYHLNGRPEQIEEDIEFSLSCCRILDASNFTENHHAKPVEKNG